MSKIIIRLSGKANCGKTTTIKQVYTKLLEKYPKATKICEENEYDIFIILSINGTIIGISSHGDYPSDVKEFLEKLIGKKCSIILTATRTKGGTVSAVKDHCPPFQMETYKQKYVNRTNSQASTNQEMAEKIVSYISSKIG